MAAFPPSPPIKLLHSWQEKAILRQVRGMKNKGPFLKNEMVLCKMNWLYVPSGECFHIPNAVHWAGLTALRRSLHLSIWMWSTGINAVSVGQDSWYDFSGKRKQLLGECQQCTSVNFQNFSGLSWSLFRKKLCLALRRLHVPPLPSLSSFFLSVLICHTQGNVRSSDLRPLNGSEPWDR